MKRVLFYDDVPIHGGHQLTAVAAARHLAAQGLEVVSAFPAQNERLHEAWRTLGKFVRLVPLPLRLTRWQPFLAPFGIASAPVRKLLTDEQPEVVVAVQGTIVQSNRAVEQAKRMSIPVVSFVPMGVHFAPGQWFQAMIARALERYHYARPDAFITTSNASRRELLEGGARCPIHVAYCGADLARLRKVPRTEARASLGIPEDRYLLLQIGRVSIGTKGHDVLLRALALARKDFSDATLLIVGDGPDDTRVDEMIRELALGDIVRRAPWRSEMSEIYSAGDLVVIASRFEGLPQVVFEAMHYGLPVVATDSGGISEVLPPSWLSPIDDPSALADTILSVRANPNGAVLQANRERVTNELNEDAFGERFAAALREIYRARGLNSR